MNTLDEFFGPKDEHGARVFTSGSNWPEAEERIRGCLDKWDEMADFRPDPKDKKVRTFLKSAMRAFVDAVGERPDLLEASIIWMRKKKLIPATPFSCISVARELKLNPALWEDVSSDSETARRRYLKQS